jgi:uncharacterized membrane protein YjjB (DUF3815 family)
LGGGIHSPAKKNERFFLKNNIPLFALGLGFERTKKKWIASSRVGRCGWLMDLLRLNEN